VVCFSAGGAVGVFLRFLLCWAVPQGRGCEPEEIAEAVIFLCSPRASHVTGHVMAQWWMDCTLTPFAPGPDAVRANVSLRADLLAVDDGSKPR